MTTSASDSGHKPNPPEPKSPQPLKTKKTGHNVIFSRSMLHGDSLYTTLLLASMILIGVCLLLFSWDFYARTHKPTPPYYAVTADEKLIRLRALRAPNLTTEALLEWVSQATTTIYTLNFNDYNQVFNKVRVYFTESGYQNFRAAIKAARIVETIVKKRLVVSAVITGTPVILKEGVIATGFYAWQVQLPMLLTYQSASDNIQSRIVLTLLVTRVPTSESVKGIGISSFIVAEATTR